MVDSEGSGGLDCTDMSEHQITLSIAGLPLTLIDEAPIHDWLLERCHQYHAKKGVMATPSWTLTIARNEQFKIGQEQLIYQLGDEPGSFFIHAYDFKAYRNACHESITVEAHPDAAIIGIVRWLMALLLVENGGLLVHSASFAHRGSGVLCPGVSGAGKSTMSKLVREQCYLFSDETAAVRFLGDVPMLYSTPFCGELGLVSGPVEAPLETILLLKHADHYATEPARLIEAVSTLVGCTFMPLREGPWMQGVMRLSEKLARRVPAHYLYFKPEPEVWSTINGIVEQAAATA